MVSYQQEHYPECYNDLGRVRNRHSSFDLRQDTVKHETRRKSLTEDFVKLGLRPREGDCSNGDVKSIVANKPILTSTFADVEALKQQLGKEKRYGSLRRYKLCSEFMAPAASTTCMLSSTANTSVTRNGDADDCDIALLLCKNNEKRQSFNLCSGRGGRMDSNHFGSVRQKYLGNEFFSKKPLNQLAELCDNHDACGAGAFELQSPAFESEQVVELPGVSSEVRGSSARFRSGIFCKPRFGRHSFGEFGVEDASLDQTSATAQSAVVSEDLTLTVGQDLGNVSLLSHNVDMPCQVSTKTMALEGKTHRDASRHILRKHHSASDMAHSLYRLHNEMLLQESHETTGGNYELGGTETENNSEKNTCFEFPSFEEFKRMQQEKSAFSHRRASANCVIPEEDLEIQGSNSVSDACNVNPTSTLVNEFSMSRVDDDMLVDTPIATPIHISTLHRASSSGASSSHGIDKDVFVRDTNDGLVSGDANEDVFSDEEIVSTSPTSSELQINRDLCNLPGFSGSLRGDGYGEQEVADVRCEVNADGNSHTWSGAGMVPDAGHVTKLSLSNPSDEGFVTDFTRDDNELDDNTLGDGISFDAKSSFQEEQTENPEEDDNSKYNPDIWNFLASSSEVESMENNSSTSSSFEKEDLKCTDCGDNISTSSENASDANKSIWCRKCSLKNEECQRAVREIIETEISYGKDLGVIKNEFYDPLKRNGLLTDDQLQTIFLNLDELIMINKYFVEKLENVIKLTRQKSDEKCPTARIARVFLDSANMLMAFQTYCINQSGAPLLLDQLSQERELLRVFLEESQKENPILRKMDLKSFLIVPVQRVMKYPLLLDRLYRVTPPTVPSLKDIVVAKKMIEETLAHINSKTIGSIKWKRRSSSTQFLNKKNIIENIEFTQLCLDLLGWNRYETYFVMMGKLLCAPLVSPRWTQQLSSLKFQTVQCTVATLGMMPNYKENAVCFPQASTMRAAALVIVKERSGKYTPLREPMLLEKCVVAMDPEVGTVFEVTEMNKESFLLKAEDVKETETWFWQLRMITKDVGRWRRRRNALANIVTHRLDNS